MTSHVVCLYELSGYAAAPWAEAGYEVYCYDLNCTQEQRDGNITYLPWDARDEVQNAAIIARHQGRTAIVLAFPPCTDLAVSGAAHFGNKRQADPKFQVKAMQLVYTARDIAEALNAPYAIENPVSVISSLWRKPDYRFHPYEYGNYLTAEEAEHPEYPDYINPMDAYPKLTCYWTGGGFTMPSKKPVPVPFGYSTQHRKLGGKSKKTKTIRSLSPRGIARAIFEANKERP